MTVRIWGIFALTCLLIGCGSAPDRDAPYCAVYGMWDCAPTRDGATRYPLCNGDFQTPMLACAESDQPSDGCEPGDAPLCCELVPFGGGWLCD